MISCILTTFNRSTQLKYGVLSILDQDFLPDEIVIVDDGSSDDTKTVVAELKSIVVAKPIEWKYIYLNHPEHRISCHAKNVGIQKAAGDILVITEPEALHIGNTIEQITKPLLAGNALTQVCTYMYTMGAKVYESLPEYDLLHPATLLNHQYCAIAEGNQQNTKAPDSDWAITGARNCFNGSLFAVKKDWLMQIGGYNEEFTGHGFDDYDLFNRLAGIGHGAMHRDDVCIVHQWHEKNYPYNIYDHAEKNGKISEEMIKRGDYVVNKNQLWGDVNG